MSQIEDILSGYSRGLYSSWAYYKPDRLLFDAGEGVIDRMSKRVYAIQRILLSHGHEDHICGIPGLVNLRNLSAGDREKPLDIYYPKGDTWVELLRDYLRRKQQRFLRYELQWRAVEPGDVIDLGCPKRPRHIEAIESRHRPTTLSLGYRILERRMSLRPEFADLPQADISRLIRERGKDAVCAARMHNVFTYSGDTVGLDPALAHKADVLLHEATYFEQDAPEKHFHCTFERALSIAQEAEVKTLVWFHASGAFGERPLRRQAAALVQRVRPPFPVYLLWRFKLLRLSEE